MTTSTRATESTSTTKSETAKAADTAGDAVSTAMERAREVADTAAAKAGDLAERASKATADIERSMSNRSDARLRLITTASVAFAAGLFAGGAPRLFVLVALAPAGLAGAALLDRAEESAITPV